MMLVYYSITSISYRFIIEQLVAYSTVASIVHGGRFLSLQTLGATVALNTRSITRAVGYKLTGGFVVA